MIGQVLACFFLGQCSVQKTSPACKSAIGLLPSSPAGTRFLGSKHLREASRFHRHRRYRSGEILGRYVLRVEHDVSSAENSISDAKRGPSRADALLEAVKARDEHEAFRLLRTSKRNLDFVAVLLRAQAQGSRCTPIMMAAAGLASPSLFEEMLQHMQAGTGASLRSRSGRTAADYAEERGVNPKIVEQLRKLEDEELAGVTRCLVCGQELRRRSRILALADRYYQSKENNPLVAPFFQNLFEGGSSNTFLRPELHSLSNTRHIHKELSESLAMVEALERRVPDLAHWNIVDLCCGKSLTSALVALRHPDAVVTAIDRNPAWQLPHYTEAGIHNIDYAA